MARRVRPSRFPPTTRSESRAFWTACPSTTWRAGYGGDAECAVEVRLAAARAGASWVVLCDTNGGSQPAAIRRGVEDLVAALAAQDGRGRVGIHTHNDCELAVANSIEGVMAGADMVQGTI